MSIDETLLLENLHILLSHNVIGDKQYVSRYKGFRGEFDFYNHLRNKNISFISGGSFMSRVSEAKPYDRAMFFSVTSQTEIEEFNQPFKLLSEIGFEKMYLVSYSEDLPSWSSKDIMGFGKEVIIPKVIIYEYLIGKNKLTPIGDSLDIISNYFENVSGQRQKNKYPIDDISKKYYINLLKSFSKVDIMDLYVTRLLFDGYIGFGKIRGIPSDLDVLIKHKGNYILAEIKEKDLSKRKPIGFGMDLHRIDDIYHLSLKTNVPYLYIVRHINNQHERKFLEWKVINMSEFRDITLNVKPVQGGTGMRSYYSKNPTKICPFEHFKDFDIYMEELL